MEDIQLHPISGWTIQVGPQQTGLITLEYLSHPMQPLETASQSPTFLLSYVQILQLTQALNDLAQAAAKRTDLGPDLLN